MTLGKIIIIATSHATLGGPGDLSSTDSHDATGIWFEELAVPYYTFIDAGYEVEIASISGGVIPIDPRSKKLKGENDDAVERFLNDPHSMAKIQSSVIIDELNFAKYDALFFPGGHGTMWDFPNQQVLAMAMSTALEQGQVVAAVCHGPAVFVGAKDAQGEYIVSGKRVAGFTNSEEDAAGLTEEVPFLLEDALKSMGAIYQSAPDFTPFVVQDGLLITGQNPASSHAIALKVIETLNQTQSSNEMHQGGTDEN